MIDEKLISGHWYHGDSEKFSTFKGRLMDSEDYSRNRNAVGPGIYFTRLAWQASGYADKGGYVYDATMNIDPSRVMTIGDKPKRTLLRQFIDLAPSEEKRDIGLSNYGESEGDPKAIGNAVQSAFTYSNNMLDSFMGLYNDMYGRDSRAFASSMVKLGYDAYLHKLPEVYHLIVWNTDAIKIEEIKPVSKYKNLKSYHEFDE